MFNGMHHVAIICSDYQRSKYFYSQILKLEIINETYRAQRQSYKLDLRLPDNSQIELFSFPDAPQRPSYPEAQGLRHLAFSVDDVESVAAYLVEHHIEVEAIRIDELTGKKFTFFSDPDGLPLELYQS
ncbi:MULTISPECIES: VOC family protein [unclassified Photobacterium]|uniref:SMU1112c/YaeR family gloxylase I-like metalloprotein n=1 Tax=unclassified Photobacterium TaxID=2628852 RepID=UPI000D1608A0|nr:MULTISPECIES: VOC family protein [unclassified Photobacterium]PSV26089.1 VOC family protein [Photobacterium sp. GB-56]PSV37727.1 VOC family protein [Photobacterium sp. GB-210]PSV51480.1 VOC family protein [Photobacterium sp. GB-1]PSV57443.1 VOC family protein [Photobacterium sp. GB-3]